MPLLLLAIAAFGIAMIGMAVGVILSNRALRGSCGGVAVAGPDGEAMTCGDCDCKLPEDLEADAA